MTSYYKNHSPQDRLLELQQDLNHFQMQLKELLYSPHLIDSEVVINKLVISILTLDRHAVEDLDIPFQKKVSDLIHYILHTPWGAPFTCTVSLLEAATTYSDEKHELSRVYSILKNLIEYQKRMKVPLFTSLDMLQKDLQDVINRFKKSA